MRNMTGSHRILVDMQLWTSIQATWVTTATLQPVEGQLSWLRSWGKHMYSVSQKIFPPPWNFLTCFPKRLEILVQILHVYYTFLSMLDYKFLFSYLQLWRSYAILSATTIMCSKCPPSTETHAGWSHLIWHNFVTVTVRDKWTKICILAWIWTFNRCVTFGLKIPNCLGKCQKMPACISVDGGHLAHMMWTGWSRLIWHNFGRVADN